MKKTTVICGPQGSFKNQIAQDLAGDKQVALVTAQNFKGNFIKNAQFPKLKPYEPGPDLFVLIVDEITKTEDLKRLATLSTIVMRKRFFAMPAEYPSPEMILITQIDLSNEDLSPERYNLINLYKNGKP